MTVERLSIELTNQCKKACWFCYSASTPSGATHWTVDELHGFVTDAAAHGVRAVSFGGGEPLEYAGVFELLERLRGVLFRSLTTNGLLLDEATLDRIARVRPDKVHVSVHFPGDVERVIEQVRALAKRGVVSGVNLLVARSELAAASVSASKLRAAGIGNEAHRVPPDAARRHPHARRGARRGRLSRVPVDDVPGRLRKKRALLRAIAWDKTVAWCSYTRTRRPLEALTFDGLTKALDGLRACLLRRDRAP